MRALVIDDSRAVRMVLCKFLRELGHESVEAGDGLEALTQLEVSEQVDIALVDWNMPNMNGLEFVKAVRSQRTYDEMRIMMVTTETEIEKVALALEAGANEYVMKPFTKEMIQEKLRLLTECPIS